MSSQVNLTTVGITDGISLANKIIVQGGVDGQFFPANQIGWGKSTFADKEFGGTTHGLLNAIETAINSVAVGGSDALNEAIETVKTTVLDRDFRTTLHLSAVGPCEVLAKDIQANDQVEILNPDLHICTIDEGGKLDMDIIIGRGRGYVSAAQNKSEEDPIGYISVDSIFTPIKAVTTA
jgi:hypothetical protein